MEHLEDGETGLVAATPSQISTTIEQAHDWFGHMSKAKMRLCAKELNWNIKRDHYALVNPVLLARQSRRI
jgi:hypothetical protein